MCTLALWLRRLLFKNSRNRSAEEHPRFLPPVIECLEARIAPATLINPNTVTFQDTDGDIVTVTVSKPVFTKTVANQVLRFDKGSVSGSNSIAQQLQLVNLNALGAKAADIDLKIEVTTIDPTGSDQQVNVGYIQATGRDVGKITVKGDLGRFVSGDANTDTPGVDLLDVGSLGALGTGTQQAGGNLETKVRGDIGSLKISNDLKGSIGVGGILKKIKVAGKLATVVSGGKLIEATIGGSIIGGAAPFSGTIKTVGDIGTISIGKDVRGGLGHDSGLIGTSSTLGSLTIGGSLVGMGEGSGVILSTGGIGTVQIGAGINGGDIKGGAGKSSGVIATAGQLKKLSINGALAGGAGESSGVILSTRDIGDVTITGALMHASGASSGQIATAGSIGNINVGALAGTAAGFGGGAIFSSKNMGNVTVTGNVTGDATANSGVISSGGTMGDVTIGGALIGGSVASTGQIVSAGNMGNVQIGGDVIGGSAFATGALRANNGGKITSVDVTGSVLGSTGASSGNIFGDGGIGGVSIGGDLTGASGNNSGEVITNGNLTSVTVGGSMAGAVFAGGALGAVQVTGDVKPSASASTKSIAADSIGNITVGGSILGTASKRVAVEAGVGSVGNVTASVQIGFAEVTAQANIGNISGQGQAGAATGIDNSTFTVTTGSIGSINAQSGDSNSALGISASTFTAAQNIGNVTAQAGASGISASTFRATAGSIGNIDSASFADGNSHHGIANSSFTAGTSIGAISAAAFAAGNDNDGVFKSTFTAGTNIASINFSSNGDGNDNDGMFGGSITAKGNITETAQFIASGAGNSNDGLDAIFFQSVDPNGNPVIAQTIISVGGNVGAMVFQSNGATGNFNDGMSGGIVNIGGSIGSITATSSAAGATNGRNDGFNGGTFNVGLTIGSITGQSLAAGTGAGSLNYGINGAHFNAGGNIVDGSATIGGTIGPITGITTSADAGSAGIVGSFFRAQNGSIGDITASTADTSAVTFGSGAISRSAFDARDSIGHINTTGHIDHSLFIAGIDLGANFVQSTNTLDSAVGAFDNAAAAQYGFGGTGAEQDFPGSTGAKIGNITLSRIAANGEATIQNTTILAGILGAGADGIFGTLDDTTSSGSGIGEITTPDGIAASHFQAGSISNTLVTGGSQFGLSAPSPVIGIKDTTFLATDASSSGTGLGSFDVTADDQDMLRVTLASQKSVGPITVTTGDAISTFFTEAGGILDSKVTAVSGSIGSINASSFGSGTHAAIRGSAFVAGTNIGAINAQSLGDNGASRPSNGTAISFSSFRAGNDIGTIAANAPNGLTGSAFDAGHSIGAINVTGPLTRSLFVVGNHLGSDFAPVTTNVSVAASFGTFNNAVATLIGYDGTGTAADTPGTAGSQIGATTVTNFGGASAPTVIDHVTYLAGVIARGTDNNFGTNDDVRINATVGALNASAITATFVEDINGIQQFP